MNEVETLLRSMSEKGARIWTESGLLRYKAPKDALEANDLEKLRALDEVSQRASGEVRKAFEELDGGLTPWQRGRYRMLEEQLERLKVDMLSKLGTKIGGDR